MDTKKQPRPRIQYEATERRIDELDQLVAEAGFSSRKELLDDALTIYQWALGEAARGNLVGSKDESGQFTQVLTMGLSHVRNKAAKGQ